MSISETMESYRLRKIAFLVRDCEKVLDVGCSASPNIYLKNKKVIGFDLDEKVNIPSNYHEIIKGNVFTLPKPFGKDSFEAITAGEIIEHLDNPMLFLKKCYEILKPGGVLVFSTPNPNSFFERILTLNLSKKYFYNVGHVSLYPQRWLIRMCELNSFKNVRVLSGGLTIPIILKNIPFPRPWAEYTIVCAEK